MVDALEFILISFTGAGIGMFVGSFTLFCDECASTAKFIGLLGTFIGIALLSMVI